MTIRALWPLSLALLVSLSCGGSPASTSASSTDASSSTGATGGTAATGTAGTTTGTTGAAPTSSGGPDGTTTDTTADATTSWTDASTSTGAALPPASLADIVDGELELIADGHMFTEGPIWSPEGYLLYSDIPANTIFRWSEGEQPAPFITPSDNSNGLAFDAMGRLLAAEHGARRISRRVVGQDPVTVVDQYQGQKLNSPNDLTIRSDGTIYFTDPPYGIQPNQQELAFQGVFRVDPQGQIALVADDFDRPNGIVLSPDESLLYVADTATERVRVFSVQPDGSAVGGDEFVDLTSGLPGNPDGMAVDVFGDIYVTGGGGVRVVTPAGVVLGTIEVPESATNCKFGDADGMALFITAPPRVYRIRLKVQGA